MSVEELIAANPFPGLRSFKPSESDRFFGRDAQIEDLLARLGEAPLLAVAGASGCGKSSLVLAGVLHELQQRRAAGEAIEWRPVVLRPGNRPIANLAAKLAVALPSGTADENSRAASLEGRLRLGGRGLIETVRLGQLAPHVRLLVVVDQFEEIFRFKRMTDAEEATAFVKLLLHAAGDSRSQVRVVVTLRSDALGYCADFRDLPEAINRGQYLVPKLTRQQRKDAIVKPVEMRGFRIAPRLVQRILNDVSDDYDDLPVMQHVLTRTWRQWATDCGGSRAIDLVDYEATGAAAEALSNHADEAYESLTGLAPVVERVFRALTERVAEGTEIRRPLAFAQLCAVAGCGQMEVEQVVERFRRPDTAFLMPPPDVLLATDPAIDISHESLIRQWQRLRQWTQHEFDSRAELLRVVEAARLYAREDGDLWRSRALERALEWQAYEQPTAAWVGMCTGHDGAAQLKMVQMFLADSKDAAARERRRSRRRLFARVLAVIVAGLSIASTLAATRLLSKGVSSELANQALLEIDRDPARSARLALDAIDYDRDNMRAEYALRRSLASLEIAHPEGIVPIGEPIADARFSKDRSRLVVASENNIRVLDPQKMYALVGGPFVRKNPVSQAWLIADDASLLSLTEDGSIQVQAVDGGPVDVLSCQGENNPVFVLAVSPDERHVAAGCSNGEIDLWDVGQGHARRRPPLAEGGADRSIITALSFSADSDYLASGDFGGKVTIWKIGPSALLVGGDRRRSKVLPLRHSAAIRDVSFHPRDARFLTTASDDHTAMVWELDWSGHEFALKKIVLKDKGARTRWPLKHERAVIKARFQPREGNVEPVMTIEDKRIHFWTNVNRDQVRRQDDWIVDAGVSDDGELAVSGSTDGTARVWSTRGGAPIAVLRGHRNTITRAFFAPDGKVLTTSLDGSLRIWNIRPPLLLAVDPDARWLLSVALDPAGKRVALSGEAGASMLDLSRPHPLEQKLDWAKAGSVSRLSWSADGRRLLGLLQFDDGLVSEMRPILWDTETRHVVTPKWLEQWRMAAFSNGTEQFVTLKSDGEIAVWDAASLAATDPEPKLRIAPKPGRVGAELSPDGKWIAAIEGDTVALWDAADPGAMARVLKGHRGSITEVKFSRDSQWVVTASTDRTARVWPVVNHPGAPAFVELAGGHGAALSSAAFNHDGSQVATSSADNTIRVWDARNGRELATLHWHGDAVNDVEFDAEGRSIISASDDGTVIMGRCEACNATIAQLRERVPKQAILAEDELRQVQAESRLPMLSALLSKHR